MVTWRLPWRNGSQNASRPEPGDPGLRPLVSGTDEAVPSSVALAEAGFEDDAPVVLRHLLRVPQAELAAVSERCISHGYVIDESVATDVVDGLALLPVAQTMVVDAVALSRERARMASAVSRAGGRVEGWVLLRAADTPVTR